MPLTDLGLADLESYRPDVEAPEDLVPFWTETLAEHRAPDLGVRVEPVANKLAVIDTFDVRFAGFGGTEVRAWLHLPAGARDPLPTVVNYLGYSNGRGFPYAWTLWAQAGYAHLILDTRGQGWLAGGDSSTADDDADSGLNHSPGFLTAGITDPHRYYYRRLYVDAVRLLDVVAALPQTDAARTVVTGASQGGGLSIAAAGLATLVDLPLLGAAPDVPFLCHFRRAVEISTELPYTEIAAFLAGWRDRHAAAYRTLSYVDGVNLGALATAPALFSVALMDPVCPPSTVYAAYHAYGATSEVAKSMTVYPHNGHEGGGPYQLDAQLDWFAERFASA